METKEALSASSEALPGSSLFSTDLLRGVLGQGWSSCSPV